MDNLDLLWNDLSARVQAEAAGTVMAAGDIRAIRDDFELAKEQELSGLDYALSLAFPLPADCLGGVVDGPTLLYKHAYTQLNYLMDKTALWLTHRIMAAGYRALPIAASQLTSWSRLAAHVDHRRVAVHLGLGWYGRNNLLVTPERGAQVRLVTALTSAPLNRPGPWAGRGSGCGECRACAAVCPVGAVHDGPEDFEKQKCADRTKEFEKVRGIGQRICGVCVRACGGKR